MCCVYEIRSSCLMKCVKIGPSYRRLAGCRCVCPHRNLESWMCKWDWLVSAGPVHPHFCQFVFAFLQPVERWHKTSSVCHPVLASDNKLNFSYRVFLNNVAPTGRIFFLFFNCPIHMKCLPVSIWAASCCVFGQVWRRKRMKTMECD